MKVRRGPLDAHADVARAPDRPGLVEGHLDTGHVELGADDRGDAFREGLDQLEAGALDELDEPLRDRFVVQRVLDAVGGGRPPDVRRDLEIDADGLADAALPLVDPDDGLDAQVVEKYRVHHGPQLAGTAPVVAAPPGGRKVSRSQRARASMAGDSASPAARRSIPA